MKLSVVVVNYNSRKYLVKCLDSVRSSVFFEPFEVIVVNNDEGKLKPEELVGKKNSFCRQRVLEINKNLGFGRACNIGAREAEGELLMFLNPDTTIGELTLKTLVLAMTNYKRVLVMSPLVLWPDGKLQAWQFGREKSPARIIFSKVAPRKQPMQEAHDYIETDWVSGTALVVKKEDYAKVGGFDENYFMYFEDVELCRRIRQLGKKVVVSTKAEVYHHSGKSFSQEKQKKKYYYRSQHYYLRKNYGWPSALLVGLARFPYYFKNILLKK